MLNGPHSKFLSTLSLRRATVGQKRLRQKLAISIHALLAESDKHLDLLGWLRVLISIHALLAESDVGAIGQLQCIPDFYPRSPCGERRVSSVINNVIDDFYPRSPCGERLTSFVSSAGTTGISIHALLAESDFSA